MRESEYTGEVVTVDACNSWKSEGKRCNIIVTVGDRQFSREAVAQPGKDISWTGMLSFNPYDREERSYLFDQISLKKDLTGEEVHCMPPHGRGTLQTGCHGYSWGSGKHNTV